MKYYLLRSQPNFDWIWSNERELIAETISYKAQPILDKWVVPNLNYVKNRGKKDFDVSIACAPLYFFSEKVIDVAEKMLLEEGEILKVESPKNNFVAFHCTTLCDALDINLSDIKWLDKEKNWIGNINKFVIKSEKINGKNIFRIPNQSYMHTFFSENFKKLVDQNNLKGFNFDSWEKIEIIEH
jgi:hypothetical protein